MINLDEFWEVKEGRAHLHFFPVCEKSLETGNARFWRREVTRLGTDIYAVFWCVGFFLNL